MTHLLLKASAINNAIFLFRIKIYGHGKPIFKDSSLGGVFMLDIVSWKLFEKTGNIDAYLLYSDIKFLGRTENIGYKHNEMEVPENNR